MCVHHSRGGVRTLTLSYTQSHAHAHTFISTSLVLNPTRVFPPRLCMCSSHIHAYLSLCLVVTVLCFHTHVTSCAHTTRPSFQRAIIHVCCSPTHKVGVVKVHAFPHMSFLPPLPVVGVLYFTTHTIYQTHRAEPRFILSYRTCLEVTYTLS